MNDHAASKLIQIALKGTVALALVGLAGWSRGQLSDQPGDRLEGLKEVLLIPSGETIRQTDLGYHTLAADLLFIRANLYYGHHMLGDEQLPWLSNYIDSLLDTDPGFKRAYEWGSMATLYYKRQVDFVPEELVQRANRILERGMERFPEEYLFPMRIAFNYYYELGDRQRALPYFRKAADKPGAPRWLRSKMTDLLKDTDPQTARQLLLATVGETMDDTLNKAVTDRLAYLMAPDQRDAVLAARERLNEQWRSRWDYLPFDLFIVVRQP